MEKGVSGRLPHGSVVKNLPARQELQEIRVPSLGQENPLEKGVATNASILAWRIICKGPGGLQSIVSWRVRHD